MIKFGLKDIVNTEDSTITDEDIEEIWKKGKVIEETAHLKKIEEKPAENAEQLENEDDDNLYLYEGKNYKEEVTANNDAFAQILVTVQAKPKKNRELEQLQSFEVAEGGASQPVSISANKPMHVVQYFSRVKNWQDPVVLWMALEMTRVKFKPANICWQLLTFRRMTAANFHYLSRRRKESVKV